MNWPTTRAGLSALAIDSEIELALSTALTVTAGGKLEILSHLFSEDTVAKALMKAIEFGQKTQVLYGKLSDYY